MKSNQTETEKDPAKQLKTFEQQPAKARELEVAEDQAEKSIGRERVEKNKKIRAQAGESDSGKSA